MKRIGVLSDTHGVIPRQVFTFFKDCDEIWHAGDMGRGVYDELRGFKPLKGVYGNADDYDLRYRVPRINVFDCEGLKVVLTHIGGWPGHYPKEMKEVLLQENPDIFVCGHSHILKVMYDQEMQFLHINPGAAGLQGFHKVGTLVRFVVDGTPKDLEVMDFPKFQRQD